MVDASVASISAQHGTAMAQRTGAEPLVRLPDSVVASASPDGPIYLPASGSRALARAK